MSVNQTKKRKGASFMKNVVMLICSQLLIKILGLVYKLVIANTEGFGDVGVGYYNAGYQIYALLLTLSSIGIPSVIAKLVSERLAIGDKSGAQRVFKVALTFFASLGLIFSFVLYFGADFIALHVYNVPDTAYVMKVLSPSIVFVSVSAVTRGYFAGQQDMKPTSVSQTLEQFLNCVLSITFVYACIGKDTYIMAAAGNLSTTLSIVIAFGYLFLYYRKNRMIPDINQISPEKDKSAKQLLKTILAISIPITLSSIVSVISSVIDTTTVSNCIQYAYRDSGLTKEALEELAMSKSGILSKVDTLTSFPLAINLAFSTALVPATAESIAKKEYNTASKRVAFSVFTSILIIFPCAVGFGVLAEPILKMIYPTAPDGAIIMQIMSVAMVFIALNQTINGGLYGLNLAKIPVISLAIGVIVKTVLNILLVSNKNINIAGASIGSVVCHLIVFAVCFTVLKRKLDLKFPLMKNVIKPAIASIVMGVAVFGVYKLLSAIITDIIASAAVCNVISTLASIAIGVIIYAVAIVILKVLSEEEWTMVPFGTKILSVLKKLHIY